MREEADAEAVRRALYVLFARLFAMPPDAAFYARLANNGLKELAAAQGIDLTSDLVDEADAEGCAAELSAEHARLFPETSLRASDYAAGAQDPVAATAAYLREHALVVDEAAGLPPDHFSVALGVMGALAAQAEEAARGRQAEALAVARARGRAFLFRHLLPWSQTALAEVSARADRRWYRGLAAMASAFLESERRLLGAA